jgi:hypothetical protein
MTFLKYIFIPTVIQGWWQLSCSCAARDGGRYRVRTDPGTGYQPELNPGLANKHCTFYSIFGILI